MSDMLKTMQEGMAFVTGYWTAPDMNWMDGESCGSGTEHCSDQPAYISNWRITTNEGPAPGPSPNPAPSPSPSPGPEQMTCGWCESGSCKGCHEEPGWCAQSESNCKQCGAKSKWCPKSAITSWIGKETPEEKKDLGERLTKDDKDGPESGKPDGEKKLSAEEEEEDGPDSEKPDEEAGKDNKDASDSD